MFQSPTPFLAAIALCAFGACRSEPKSKDDSPPKATVSKTVDDPEKILETKEPPKQTHANGMARFKDPGVYVDGKPIGVLRFGELPVPLPPVWIEERAAVPFKRGDTGPRFVIKEQRRYRFTDYFRAMGVDVAKIRELHIYGGNKKAAAVVIPGDNLRKEDDFLFRFGGDIWGKPLPACPASVGDGKCPDQIGSLSVYIDKDPPRREGGYFYFGDERVEGVPYFGEPLRGGVRVYMNGPLATTIKRNKLVEAKINPVAVQGDKETFELLPFLASQGVDTDAVQEVWLVRYERRVEKLNREQFLKARFVASKGGSGEVLVGPNQTETHAIALHSKALTPEEMPQLKKHEMEKADG